MKASLRRHLHTGDLRGRLAAMGALVAVGLSTLEPTPLGLAAAAIVLLGVSVAVWAARCPHCGRHLGLIVGFRYCTGCGRRT